MSAAAEAATALARVGLKPDDESNRALVDAVHPPDWQNPEPAALYDLVVIGAGTAGLVTAAGAAGLGARVALIERHLMGGDCLNVGCVPSKALISSGRVAARARAAEPWGVQVGAVDVDFAAVMARMRKLRAGIAPIDGASRFRSLGVDVFLGAGRFVSGREIEVSGSKLRFVRAVIATGARAAVPPIPGLAEAGYLTNDTVFELTALPARLVVIGGGPIGCELAQCFARFGSQVTVIEALPGLLAKEEPAAGQVVAERLAREGVRVLTAANVVGVESGGAGAEAVLAGSDTDGGGAEPTVVVQTADNADRGGDGSHTMRIAADAILVAAGRQANIDDLGLEQAQVAAGRRGVTVDARMRTSNRRIYAAGDVASAHQFTLAADAMARLVLQNALFFGRRRASDLVIPRVTFTDPEVAAVGLTAAQAEAAGIAVSCFEVALEDVDRAIVDGETEGFIRVLVARGSDRIVGATIVAPHAGEAIGEIALAMSNGLGLGAIASTIHAYPTMALGLRQVADQYNRTRLTPLVARVLRWILALRRR